MFLSFHWIKTLSKVKQLQFQIEGMLFCVRFIRNNAPPMSKTVNGWLWKMFILCMKNANVYHQTKNVEIKLTMQ